jgi:heme-degrading monooxygenase HmoA
MAPVGQHQGPRWASEEAYQAWVSSPAFAHGHRGVGTQGGHPGA